MAADKVNEIFPYANIDMLWKITNVTVATGVVERVKSRMLNFFLELDKKQKLGIDFNQLEGRKEAKQVMNQTINAGIYYSGSGVLNTVNSIVASSLSIDKATLAELIKSIRECHELDSNAEAEEELTAIEEEMKEAEPRPKFIKKSLLFLKDVAVNIGANIAAQYITSALAMF